MKICFLCNEYPPARHGGIGRVTRTMAQSLAEAGHEARVIGIYPKSCQSPEFENDGGVLVHRLRVNTSRLGWIRARVVLYRTIAEWATKGLIDVLETPDYEGLVARWPALPVPIVTRLHGSSSYFAAEMGAQPSRLAFCIERASLRRSDFICSTSRYTGHQTKKLFGLRDREMTVLYNSVAVPDSVPRGPRVPGKVVFTGTLTRKKGIVSLIRAWPIVSQRIPHAELHVFGKAGRTNDGGSMQEFLLSSLPSAVRPRVRFHGHVEMSELTAAFRSASVAVFPSYSEAFALGPMEAMVEACPIIYTRRSSGAELVRDGEDGLLIDPDNYSEIADAIVRILNDAKLANSLGVAGRKRIEWRFSPQVVLPQNIDFYHSCIRLFQAPATFLTKTAYSSADQAEERGVK